MTPNDPPRWAKIVISIVVGSFLVLIVAILLGLLTKAAIAAWT